MIEMLDLFYKSRIIFKNFPGRRTISPVKSFSFIDLSPSLDDRSSRGRTSTSNSWSSLVMNKLFPASFEYIFSGSKLRSTRGEVRCSVNATKKDLLSV